MKSDILHKKIFFPVIIILFFVPAMFSGSAYADIKETVSYTRQAVSLDGTWKYINDDNSSYSDPAYDDSSWSARAVPDDGTITDNYSRFYH